MCVAAGWANLMNLITKQISFKKANLTERQTALKDSSGENIQHTLNLSSTEMWQELPGFVCFALWDRVCLHDHNSGSQLEEGEGQMTLFFILFWVFVYQICNQAMSEVNLSKYLHMDLFPKSISYLLLTDYFA